MSNFRISLGVWGVWGDDQSATLQNFTSYDDTRESKVKGFSGLTVAAAFDDGLINTMKGFEFSTTLETP